MPYAYARAAHHQVDKKKSSVVDHQINGAGGHGAAAKRRRFRPGDPTHAPRRGFSQRRANRFTFVSFPASEPTAGSTRPGFLGAGQAEQRRRVRCATAEEEDTAPAAKQSFVQYISMRSPGLACHGTGCDADHVAPG
jgi:hypothetical protein